MAERNSKFMNVYDLVDAAISEDPSALQRALTMMSPEAAAKFYREECSKNSVGVIQSFSRQINANAACMDFSNNYFGDRGIIPVMATLQHLPIVEARFLKCDLNSEDIARIQSALMAHPTLTSLDLRGNLLSLPSSRKLLSLAIQNRRLTSIVLDDTAPKSILIQRQCLANANVAVHASACVMCQKSMVHSITGTVENKIFVALEERLGTRLAQLCIAEVETLFRCLLACTDVNDGVLFLCSVDCINHLAGDIAEAMRLVVNSSTLDGSSTREHHRHPVLARCVVELVESYSTDDGAKVLFRPPVKPFGDPKEGDWTECKVCGCGCVPLHDSAAFSIVMLCRDVKKGTDIRPTALLRIIHTMLRYVRLSVCGRKCVRHLTRFGIYGYGGVIRANPSPNDVALTSIDVPLDALPDDDFCVVNFAELQVLDHGEEDTACAVTVASLMSDIDTIPIDPYIIFAVGRYLVRRGPTIFGMELRQACDAVRVTGCLSVDQSPFHRKNRPPRAHYVEWQKWSAVSDVDKLQRLCFARRRQSYFLIDGPADNVFDRIRAALWAFREQHRCVAVVIKFCLAWINVDQGIIPADLPPRGGFYTCAKVVGQTLLQNSYYLVIQPNFGVNVGNRGFFYIPRSIFNRSVRGAAYMFVDTTAIRESQGIQPKQYHQKLVSRTVVRLLDKPSLMFDVVNFVASAAADGTRLTPQLRSVRDIILATMPPSVLFMFVATGIRAPHQFTALRESLLRLFENSRGTTQLAFLWNEILGDAAAKWALQSSEKLVAAKRDGKTGVDSNESSFGLVHGGAPTPSAAAALLDTPEEILWNTGGVGGSFGSPGMASGSAGSFRIKSPSTNSTTRFVRTPPAISVGGAAVPKPPAKDEEPPLDPMFAAIEESLKAEREARIKVQSQLHHRSASSWDPALLGYSALRRRNQSQLNSTIPQDLVGARWSSVVLMDDACHRTSELLMFIKGNVCGYNYSSRTLTTPLRKMETDPKFSKFPFINGFDCVVQLSHVKKPEAYFFSEQTWMIWDISRNYCVTGPHVTRTHRVFRSLPTEYHQRVDGACELPGKNVILLFSQFRYVVFDIDSCCVLQTAIPVSSPEGPFCKLSKLFPSGPMTLITVGRAKNSRRQLMIGYDGMVASTGIDATGALCFADASISNPASPSNIDGNTSPICDTFFCGLPLAFLQQTTLASPSILSTLLDAAPRNKLVSLTLFEPVAPDASMKEVVASEHGLGGLESSWEVKVTSTLSTVNISQRSKLPPLHASSSSEDVGLNGIMKPFSIPETMRAPTLLQHSALLRHDDEDDDGSHSSHVVEFDLGTMNASAFAYVQVLLDTATVDARVLQVAPIEIVVERSHDGVCYTDVGVIIATASAASTYWGVVHAARYWRLRFVNAIPIGVGIVKVLWYKAQWVVDASPYELTETFSPSPSAVVTSEAAMLLRKPSELLVDIAPQPVLCIPRDDHWTPRHAVLPLLPDGDSCLFFCGNVMLEYDFLDEHVVGNRCVSLSSCPAFSQLPFPFCDGLDAIFYPNIHDHSTVIMLRDEKLIVWDLMLGAPVTAIEDFADSKYFKGLPFPVKRLNDVINIWDYPGHVFVFSDNKVLRWNVLEATVVEGPYTREQIPVFDVPQFAETPYLAVVSFPGDARTFFIFCGTEVVESVLQRDHKVIMKPPAEFRTTDFFNTISRYLEWGVPRDRTSVIFDFKENIPLVIGLTMRSSDGCNPGTRWSVEFSNDGVHWENCSEHVQAVPRSSSSWHLDDVQSVSHRFWRLTTIPGTTSMDAALATIVYSQVLFHVLPCTLLSVSPAMLDSSGEIMGGPASLLTASLGLHLTPPSLFTVDDELVVDFGVSPVELVGLSCRICPSTAITNSRGASPSSQQQPSYDAVLANRDSATNNNSNGSNNNNNNVTSFHIIVSCSDDGLEWSELGTWRTIASTAHVRWSPTYPKRFWQLRFSPISGSSKQRVALDIRDIALFENAAPSLVTNESSDVTKLVGILQSTLTSYRIVDFEANDGSILAMDFKQSPQALVGIVLAIDVDSFTFMTNFEVEYSDDGLLWCVVGTLVSCDDLGNAAWGSEGSHRYWRLRVSRHRGAKTVRIKRLELSVSGPMMYQHHSRHITKVDAYTYKMHQDRLAAFVSVTATIPPHSAYAVERQDPNNSWVPVGVLMNADPIITGAQKTPSRERTCGWPPCQPSASWRLRPIVSSSLAAAAASPPLAENVSWSSLSSQTSVVAVLPSTVRITTVGFDEDQQDSSQDNNAFVSPFGGDVLSTSTEVTDTAWITPTMKQRQLGAFDLTAKQGNHDSEAHATWVFNCPPVFSAVTVGLFVDDHSHRNGNQDHLVAVKPGASATPAQRQQQLLTLGTSSEPAGTAAVSPEPQPAALMLVEISTDGVIFVPVASTALFPTEIRQINLTWPHVSAPRWRIRFAELSFGPFGGNIRFSTVQWGFENAVSSFPRFESKVNLTSSLSLHYHASDSSQRERQRLRGTEGLQQFNSVATGLRSPDDLDQYGHMTQPLVALQKAFQKQMVKHLKENRGDGAPQKGGGAGGGAKPSGGANAATGAVDLVALLKKMAVSFHDDRFHALCSLLQSASADEIVVSLQELKLIKDSMSWCGPKSEYRGKIAAPLFGFADITVAVALRWTLTSDVLRHTMKYLTSNCDSASLAHTMTDPMIVLELNKTDWFAGAAFPKIGALLYEYRISERAVTLVLATREMQFSPPQINFVPPGGQPLQSKNPFSIYAGANFIVASIKPKEFLSPATVHICAMLPKVVLDKPVLCVVTVSSFMATESTARFTVNVPDTFFFNIPGLKLGHMMIEIVTDLSKKDSLERRRVSFFANQALIAWGSGADCVTPFDQSPTSDDKGNYPNLPDYSGGGDPSTGDLSSTKEINQMVPLHVAGTLGTSTVHIQARSFSGASIQSPCGLQRSTLANIRFCVDVLLTGAKPADYFPCPVVVNGTICTNCGLTFPAQLALGDIALGKGNIRLDLNECKFSTIVQLAAFLINAPSLQLSVAPWMEEVPLRVTGTMVVYPSQQAAKAVGMVTFYGQSGRINVSVTTTGVHMSFTLPSLRLGNLSVMGSEATDGFVLIEAAAPVGGTSYIRLDGLCRTLARSPAPAQIELSAAGTLVISSGTFYDVCVRDDSLYPIGAYATVSVSRDTFVKPLAASLKATSLIATLLSHGLPFSFGLHAVTVTNCALERQAMQLTFRGVLFGFRFDVSTQVTSPENSDRTIAVMCEGLASHIMEQCNETLWSSLDTFVGSAHNPDADDSSESSGFGEKSVNSGLLSFVGPTLLAPTVEVADTSEPSESSTNKKDQKTARRDRVAFAVGIIGSPPSTPHVGNATTTADRNSASLTRLLPLRAGQRRGSVAREGTFLAHWCETDAQQIDAMIAEETKDV